VTAICLEEMRKATKPLERTVHLHTDYEAGIAYIRSRNAPYWPRRSESWCWLL